MIFYLLNFFGTYVVVCGTEDGDMIWPLPDNWVV